jgi:PKD repeat protein
MKKTAYSLAIATLFSTAVTKAQTFNYYFGNIHSQSSYSDGNQDSATSLMRTPLQDFNYANQSQHIDFYGISDHNHYQAGMLSPTYFHKGMVDAEIATVDGSFVALYGQEWGVISGGGHAIVYGYDSLMGWDFGDYDVYVAKSDYANLWKKVNAKKGAFAYLAHPANTDYNNLFTAAYDASADSAIFGMAARSGGAFSTNTTYSNPATSSYITRYNDALKLGYHLGVGLDHDSHNSVFGRQTAGRLVVIAPTLSRVAILDAFTRMHFYSSDDWNAQVNFNINSQPMGSIYSHTGSPTIAATITDPDGEATSSIAIYYGIPGSGSAATVLNAVSSSNTLSYTHTITNNATYYYYLKITQADGDIIWTSPIWYTRNDAVSSAPTSDFIGSPTTVCAGQSVTYYDMSANNPTSWLWTFPGGTPASSTSQNPTVTYNTAGNYNATLKAMNGSGNNTTTITNYITINPIMAPTVSVTSSPSGSACNGASVVFTANPTTGGINPAYQWKVDGTNVGTNSSSYATSTLTNGQTISCIITSSSACASPATATSNSLTMTIKPVPPTPTITQNGMVLTSSSATGNQWYLNGVYLSGQNNQTYTVSTNSNYTVAVTSNGCTATSAPLFVSTTGIEEPTNDYFLAAYPNPNEGNFTVSFNTAEKSTYTIELRNTLGQLIFNDVLTDYKGTYSKALSIQQYGKGVYTISLTNAKKETVKKIVVY